MVQHTEGYMPIDHGTIYYRLYGREHTPPVLLLHGNGEDGSIFDKQVPALAQHFQVVLMDSRAHGRSVYKPDGPVAAIQDGRRINGITLAMMAQDAAALLDWLGLSQAAVVGFSDGANIALQMALHMPDRVSRMVLAGGNLTPAGVQLGTQLPIVFGYGVCALLSHFFSEAEMKRQILGLMVKQPHVSAESLNALKCPVLVMAGSRDCIKRSHTELIARAIPDAQLCIVPDSGHNLFASQPNLVNQILLAFLSK